MFLMIVLTMLKKFLISKKNLQLIHFARFIFKCFDKMYYVF